MGKSAMRRQRRQREFLGQLAERDPDQFKLWWMERLEGWAKEATYRARNLKDEPVFALIEDAMRELAEYGTAALDNQTEATIAVLTDACSKAVAMAVDPRMDRL